MAALCARSLRTPVVLGSLTRKKKGDVHISPPHIAALRLLSARLMINREGPAKNHSLGTKNPRKSVTFY
jgi:hypothetical protein